ncbi:hypothetical protein [Salinispira pacifica]
MEGESSVAFLGRLQDALSQRRESLERTELPQLKDNFRTFHLSYQAFYNVLRRKGLVDEDPYKNDQKISEISAPSNSPFLDSERNTQMSLRLSDFDSQLEFLNHYYQFSLDFITLRRIKDLVGLTSYIRWSQLSQTSENMTTRVLAELLEKVVKGGDQMSTSIIGDAHGQLAKLQRQILALLKKLADFQREAYKLELRRNVMPDVNLPESPLADLEGSIKVIKRVWSKRSDEEPFYGELAQEILQEDWAPNADARREEVINRITVKEVKRERKEQGEDLRRVLVDGMRMLANSSRTLGDCSVKLKDNAILLENRRKSFGERFRLWIMRALGHKVRKNMYEVTYNDITTSAVQRETIDFNDFTEHVDRKGRMFAGILARTGTVARKIEAASEDQLFSFLARNISEVQLMHRRLQSLDSFFKDAVTAQERTQMRGIKIELSSLKNSIIKANQKKHEYVARKEEIDQLRKLGVNVGPGEGTSTPPPPG